MPQLVDNFTDTQAMAALEEFLAAPARPGGAMSYLTLAGFFFAVSNAPETIIPSEWMPIVFDDEDPNYQSEEELRWITTPTWAGQYSRRR